MAFVTNFFGSGNSFFLGVGLILLGVVFKVQRRWKRLGRLTALTVVLGATLVTLSATPLPYWLYAVIGVLTLVWLVSDRWLEKRGRSGLGMFRAFVFFAWVSLFGWEYSFRWAPAVPFMSQPMLWIVADSVTAGVGDPSVQTWPKLLTQRHQLAIQDLSQPGETLGSALRTIGRTPVGPGLVVLEIGGNDMLGSTSDDDFEERLDRLLAQVSNQGQRVVMFELPLPPFRNALGMTQRRLAAKHGVHLIPKRLFVGILTTQGATIDGIHLTQQGQNMMADLIWSVVAPAYGK